MIGNKRAFKPRWSRTRYGSFGRIFRRGSLFEKRIARLIVLYEDLRIEVLGAALDPSVLPDLEPSGPHYRQFYFMRRAIATVNEFRQAIEQLAHSPELRELEGKGPPLDYIRYWKPAVAFFRAQRGKLKSIRNDVGGHFGDQAVENAFAVIPDDFTVSVEIQADSADERTRLVFPFAAELSAVALIKHLAGENPQSKTDALLELLQKCAEHGVEAVHFLTVEFVWNRMA